MSDQVEHSVIGRGGFFLEGIVIAQDITKQWHIFLQKTCAAGVPFSFLLLGPCLYFSMDK